MILGENNQIVVGMSPDFTHQLDCRVRQNRDGHTRIYPLHPIRRCNIRHTITNEKGSRPHRPVNKVPSFARVVVGERNND